MASEIKLRVPVSAADHSLGLENAPLQLLEYGDYECPFSGLAYHVVNGIERTFGENFCFIYRHFPLTQIHSHAMEAAMAAEAANEQGKFWEMHNLLFENQEKLHPDRLYDFAVELGMNLEMFAHDLTDPILEKKILNELYSGVKTGVNGTPTFFLNGIRYQGGYQFEALSLALQAELERSGQSLQESA